MSRAELTEKLHEFVDRFHKYDLAGASAMYAEDAVAVHFTGHQCVGRDAIRELMRPFFSKQYGEMHFHIIRIDIDEPNNIAWSEWIMTLTKDGVSNASHGVDTFEFKDGLIVRNSAFVKSEHPASAAK